jgi:hypothetical protein
MGHMSRTWGMRTWCGTHGSLVVEPRKKPNAMNGVFLTEFGLKTWWWWFRQE